MMSDNRVCKEVRVRRHAPDRVPAIAAEVRRMVRDGQVDPRSAFGIVLAAVDVGASWELVEEVMVELVQDTPAETFAETPAETSAATPDIPYGTVQLLRVMLVNDVVADIARWAAGWTAGWESTAQSAAPSGSSPVKVTTARRPRRLPLFARWLRHMQLCSRYSHRCKTK